MKTHLPFKSILSVLSVSALLVGVACTEDEVSVFAPTELAVSGPDEVAPGDTATFAADRYDGESYTWTVPAAGVTILEGAGTPVITATFTAAGSGDITVAARGVEGTKTVEVVTANPVASVALDSGVILSGSETGRVLINFDQDIATAPEVALVSADGVSGSTLSAVERVDDRTFQVTYTPGAGNGTERVSVTDAVSSEFFGSVNMDTVLVFSLYEVDNTSATGELFASRTPVSDDAMITLSAVFSEPLSTTDSVKVSVVGPTTAYVTNASMTTQDGATWTYDFQPTGGANELVTVSVSSAPADRAGNATDASVVEPIIVQIKND